VFRPDPTIPFIIASRDGVVTLLESINQPQISIPSKPPQAAYGYLCGVRNPDNTFTLYVCIFLPASAENVVYTHEPPVLPIEHYRPAESEGRQFLESMGFMLDDLRFRGLAPEQQDRTLERLPIFSRPKQKPAAPSLDPAARQAAIARLLSSF
jgi:hypothetical protein